MQVATSFICVAQAFRCAALREAKNRALSNGLPAMSLT